MRYAPLTRRFQPFGLMIVILVSSLTAPVDAQQEFDFNVASGDFSNALNWSPLGVPAAGDDVFVSRNLLNTWVTIDQPIFFMRNLTLVNGGRLSSNNNEIMVEDTILIDGPLPGAGVNATLHVSDAVTGTDIFTSTMRAQNGGVIDLDGGTIEVEAFSIDQDSRITGDGIIVNSWVNTEPFIFVALVLDGLIKPDAGGTIDLRAGNVNITIDLDGRLAADGLTRYDLTEPNSRVLVSTGAFPGDHFSGLVEIGSGSTMDFGNRNVDGQVDMLAAFGTVATARRIVDFEPGALLRVLSGEGLINDSANFNLGSSTLITSGSTLRLRPLQAFTLQNGSAFQVDGTLELLGNTVCLNPIINGSGNIILEGSLHVQGGTTFDVPDGFCRWSAFTTSSPGQALIINAIKITDGDPSLEGFDSFAELNGDLQVNTTDAWRLHGSISFHDEAIAKPYTLSGAPVIIADTGELNVEFGTLNVEVPVLMEPGAELSADMPATLITKQPVTMLGGGIFGEFDFSNEIMLGTYVQEANLTVAGPSTIDVGEYRWNGDGAGPTYPQIFVQTSASLEVRASNLVPRKGLTLVNGPLTVTDEADDQWELIGNLSLRGGGSIGTPVDCGSEMIVTDTGKLDAVLGIASTSSIESPLRIESPASMEASFGATARLNNVTTLAGGLITGAGTVVQNGDLVVETAGSQIDVKFYDWDGASESNTTTILDNARLVVAGGEIDLNNPLFDGYDGDIIMGANSRLTVFTDYPSWKMQGSLHLSPGCHVKGEPIANGGIVTGSGLFESLEFRNSGIVAPSDNSPGSPYGWLNVYCDNYQQFATGTTRLDIGGTTPGITHDVINANTSFCNGFLELDGTLELNLAPGYVPEVGQSFTIMRGKAPTVGTFAQVTGNAVFDISYTATDVIATFTGDIFCPADTNNDGIVNVADLLILLAAWGPNPGHPADTNNDGDVNVADLLTLLAAWGACD